MGRSFDTHEELDRPDLNKCPDCGCFFAQEHCPLCGKACPEEMRAGNRKPVKKAKQKSGGSDRVTFVQWYHSWWFIIVMLFVFPIAGVVLFATSPHSKKSKIIFGVIVAAAILLSTFGPMLAFWAMDIFAPSPVDTSLTKDEYVAKCEVVDAEHLYRNAAEHEGEFVTIKLVVKEKTVNYYQEDYTTYYVCEDESGKFEFIILDCSQDMAKNFLAGDVITVFGEVTEPYELYINDQTVSAPSINVAYITFEQ